MAKHTKEAASASLWSRFEAAASKRPRLCYYLVLYVAVIIAFLGMNCAMLAVGRECIWHVDAQPLYLNIMAWNSQVLRDAIATFLGGGGFQVPLFTYSLGYGADTSMTMGGYLDDPLNLLAVPFPVEYTNIPYVLLIVVRLLLAATTFSWYCLSHGNSRKASGVAALVYVCCGFVVFWGALRHPKFIDWSVLFPLMLMGADRIFDRKSPALFVVTMFLQFFTSVYYSYMGCVALLFYCLIKYFFVERERSVLDFVRLVAYFAAMLLIGFAISAAFSLPQIIALLSQGRATSGAYVPVLFSPRYYARIAAELVGGDLYARGIAIGSFSLLSSIVFLTCRKRFDKRVHTPWLIGLALCIVGILVPFIGHMFNGMGYVTDRWMLIVGFVCSYIACLTLPVLQTLDARDWRRVGAGVAVIVVWVVAYCAFWVAPDDALLVIWPLCMAAILVATFLTVKRMQVRPDLARTSTVAGIIVVGCITLSCGFYCTPLGETYGAHFPVYGRAGSELTDASPAAPIDHIDDDGVFRHSYPRVYGGMKNSSLVHGSMGIDFYSSYYNQLVDDFRQELGMSDHHLNYSYVGSTFRLPIEDVTGAKYFVATDEDAKRIPYGFVDTGADWGEYHVYRNENPVPLAFASDKIVTRETYEGLSATERQEALMQGIVVDPSQLSGDFEQADIEFSQRTLPYKVAKTEGLTVEDGVVHVLQEKGAMTITFDGMDESETYLSFANLNFTAYSPADQERAKGGDPTAEEEVQSQSWTAPAKYKIWVKGNGDIHNFTPTTPEAIGYSGKVDWVVNMGYSKKGLSKMIVRFNTPGDYTFDSLSVVCQPVKPVVEQAKALAARGLDDLKLEMNRMSASVTLDDDGPELAFFSIACTPGWSAKVDGEPAEVIHADTAFMAVEVSGAGKHEIEWTYLTPGLAVGARLSLAGIAALALVLVVERLLRRRREEREGTKERG